MATQKSVGDPLGEDKKPGSDLNVDAKEYVMYVVDSTKHWFHAPRNKYKDIASSLGLKEVKPDSKEAQDSNKLAGGQGYVRLGAKLSNGATLMVICDPVKIGTALAKADDKKIYGVSVTRIYIPKKRVLI